MSARFLPPSNHDLLIAFAIGQGVRQETRRSKAPQPLIEIVGLRFGLTVQKNPMAFLMGFIGQAQRESKTTRFICALYDVKTDPRQTLTSSLRRPSTVTPLPLCRTGIA